jgi:hypothetical protein
MNTRHSSKITRTAAELLLDGSGSDHARSGDDLDLLARVLAAAAAPVRDDELAGERMAVAAFEAALLTPHAPSPPEKEQKTMLAKILTAKILLTSVAAFATGGVALAASTGALTTSAPAKVSASANASVPATGPTQGVNPAATPSTSASAAPSAASSAQPGTGIAPKPVASPSPSTSASHTPLPQTAAALCNALIGDVAGVSGGTLGQAGQVQALSSSQLPTVLKNPEFTPLTSTAQSVTAVSDYCALLLDLPDLPDPSALAALPGTVLGQLLTALPTSTLTGILTQLPTSVLGSVLTSLPTSSLSSVLNALPASTVSQLLNSLPTSVLSQLPTSVLSGLPQSVLSSLPTGLLSGLGL